MFKKIINSFKKKVKSSDNQTDNLVEVKNNIEETELLEEIEENENLEIKNINSEIDESEYSKDAELKDEKNNVEFIEEIYCEESENETELSIDNLDQHIKEEQESKVKKESEIIQKHKENDIESTDDLEVELSQIDIQKELLYIKEIKILREKSIKAINLYTLEEVEYETYSKCSKGLKIPKEYIIENLMYGYTDYFGQAIMYLSKELGIKEYEKGYIKNSKTPIEIFNNLNDKIFDSKISEEKRDEILNNPKIHKISMHYKFECIDSEYNEYYQLYKDIIKRGGKKKVEVINTKGEVIDIFKSVDDCAKHINQDKQHVVEMLKLGNTKVGRYNIRYSLRNI